MRFTFLDPGPLIDGDLQLVAPQTAWVDELIHSTQHPLTLRDAPAEANLTRTKVMDFLRAAPMGRQAGDESSGRVPAYHFWMLAPLGVGDPPIRIVGGLGLRIGASPEIERYSGNICYHVYPPARG